MQKKSKNNFSKILILSPCGYLGSYLSARFSGSVLFDVKAPFSTELYFNDSIEYVINCAGITNVNECDLNEEKSLIANSLIINDIFITWPNAKLINFSSYYVYDDIGFCTEDSKTTNVYNYAKHKLLGENLSMNGKSVTFRLGKLFGNHHGSQNRLTEYIMSAKKSILDNVKFNPTSVSQVADVIQYELENKTLFGVYNLSNDGYTTHYEWGMAIKKYMKLNNEIELSVNLQRDLPNYGKFLMSVEKLNAIMPLRHWEVDLIDFCENL